MINTVTPQALMDAGLPPDNAASITQSINDCITQLTAPLAWRKISKEILVEQYPFSLYLFLFSLLFPNWQDHPDSAPAVIPTEDFIAQTNLAKLMALTHHNSVRDFHAWSVQHYVEYWQLMLQELHIVFSQIPTAICSLEQGVEAPQWLLQAKLNIAASCFTAKASATAIIFRDQNNILQKMSYAELNILSNRIANGLLAQGFIAGDAIAIDMPLTVNAIAIYLGIIKMGGVVVSIADSFSSEEIAIRLRAAHAKAIFTQDVIAHGEKNFPLYAKVIAAHAPTTIVLPHTSILQEKLRASDIAWQNFLSADENFTPYAADPMAPCNILFSSGTTGEPKAIPWNSTTAIKAASDAFLHQNIQAGDVLAWPTNLGWMMGPWLIFAAFINQASIAVCADIPRERAYGEFIQQAKVTMLGVVPTLVATWRHNRCMEGLDWSHIKVFSSTGECSNAEDMFYLMWLAHFQPVIEYCGGTEIGGAYLSSTVVENNYPAVFSTPTFGLDLVLLNSDGKPADNGEVALVPPSMGLSVTLLNADHHQIYFANMPTTPDGKILRRHGDQAQRLAQGHYCILGRADDTMNLSGIKISAAEIERVLAGLENIMETAAIALAPAHNGPSQLIIFAATNKTLDKNKIIHAMQTRINKRLNPLFKIHDIVFTPELPKTASNKIMRRILRDQYQEKL